jgi:hypothetical protein
MLLRLHIFAALVNFRFLLYTTGPEQVSDHALDTTKGKDSVIPASFARLQCMLSF